MLDDAISILELCCKSTRAELLALYRNAAKYYIISDHCAGPDVPFCVAKRLSQEKTLRRTRTRHSQILSLR